LRRVRWAHLLDENRDFRRWHDNLARGSKATARERARVLYRFLRIHQLTPEGLIELASKDRRGVEDLLMDFVSKLHEEKKSPGYIEYYVKTVRSWLEFNGIRLIRKIKIGNARATPTLDDERIPTHEELSQLLSYAGIRGRCSMALMAFSGLRPQVLGNIDGTMGLEIRDIPDLEVNGGDITFTQTPARVIVRPPLSKARNKYFTFLIGEGCNYLNAYLEERFALGEKLERESPIIAVKSGYEETGLLSEKRLSRHVTTKSITKEIREAMRPRFKWRPYVLRAYFDTQLMVAENHGKISHAYRQFFMGHKGDMEARYTTNKGRLPEGVIKDMRSSIRECESYLSTRVVLQESDVVKEAKLEALKSVAKSMFDLDIIEIKVAKERDIGRELNVEEEIAMFENEMRRMRSREDEPQIIVEEEELGEYLKDGWRYVTALPSNKILIKK
jgi:hypothetical protein